MKKSLSLFLPLMCLTMTSCGPKALKLPKAQKVAQEILTYRAGSQFKIPMYMDVVSTGKSSNTSHETQYKREIKIDVAGRKISNILSSSSGGDATYWYANEENEIIEASYEDEYSYAFESYVYCINDTSFYLFALSASKIQTGEDILNWVTLGCYSDYDESVEAPFENPVFKSKGKGHLYAKFEATFTDSYGEHKKTFEAEFNNYLLKSYKYFDYVDDGYEFIEYVTSYKKVNVEFPDDIYDLSY